MPRSAPQATPASHLLARRPPPALCASRPRWLLARPPPSQTPYQILRRRRCRRAALHSSCAACPLSPDNPADACPRSPRPRRPPRHRRAPSLQTRPRAAAGHVQRVAPQCRARRWWRELARRRPRAQLARPAAPGRRQSRPPGAGPSRTARPRRPGCGSTCCRSTAMVRAGHGIVRAASCTCKYLCRLSHPCQQPVQGAAYRRSPCTLSTQLKCLI